MLKDNNPNAAKLITSLRNTGYNSYAAVEDIIDNSIDAGARHIDIAVRSNKGELNVIIADNGCGMSEETLDDALKLGSMFEKDEAADLGKYGMGLVTASISMSKKLEVITKTKDGEYLYSSQDLDDMVEHNRFVKEVREANKEEITTFKDLIKGDQGTVVHLSKVDRLSDSNITQFASKLGRDIARIYRKFIESGVEIKVNDKLIKPEDPLMQDNSETNIYSDEEYDVPVSGRKQKLRVKIAILPDVNHELEKELRMNIRSQGFYVLRNNREIAAGETLDIFSKHNDFNRLRIELAFDSSLDNEMGVRFSKDGVAPNQAITDFLKQEIGGQISSIRKLFLKPKKADSAKEVNHEESANVIARKAKLLIVPDAEIEKRSPKKNKNTDKKDPKGDTKKRVNLTNVKTSPSGMGARFETVSMDSTGPVYDCYQEGKIIVIRWNVDHPFYEKVVLPNKDTKGLVSGLDYLVFGLASAELKVVNDDNVSLIENIKAVMSSNVRSLLN